jgi:hypothetical protein
MSVSILGSFLEFFAAVLGYFGIFYGIFRIPQIPNLIYFFIIHFAASQRTIGTTNIN